MSVATTTACAHTPAARAGEAARWPPQCPSDGDGLGSMRRAVFTLGEGILPVLRRIAPHLRQIVCPRFPGPEGG